MLSCVFDYKRNSLLLEIAIFAKFEAFLPSLKRTTLEVFKHSKMKTGQRYERMEPDMD